jgi:WD40 repeat protein
VYDVATREKKADLDSIGLSIHELGWVAEGQRIVGLVTTKGNRGEVNSLEEIVLWDAATGKRLQAVTYPTAMNVLAVAPDGRSFAEAGVDKQVRVRDAETLAIKQSFRAHDGPITVLAFHPSRPILATGSEDLTVKIWDLESLRTLEEFHSLSGAPWGKNMNFSPSGRRLAWRAYPDTGIWEPASLNPTAAKKDDRGHLDGH